MTKRPTDLPSLNGLRMFEAAARHCSFKQAADELFVTQAAISRQIRQLEEQLNTKLFLRGHRQVELTEAGRKLFQTVNQSFCDIAEVSQTISGGSHSLESINLFATSSFAHLWLIPRLAELRKLDQHFHFNLISVEENPRMAENFDAAITLGLEDASGYQADFLFSEQIFPVCTPSFLEQNPQVESLEGLVSQPLLDLDPKHWKARWWSPIDWKFWLQQFSVETDSLKTDINFSHFPMLLDAVLQGVGVGLGWQHLVQDMLDDGRLIQPVKETYPAPQRGHYFVCRNDLATQPEIIKLRQWLLEQTAVFRQA